jgi:hypothetical protein
MRTRTTFLLWGFFVLSTALLFGQTTPRGTAQVTVEGKRIVITYGRPDLEGRNLIGFARPGMVWRLGQNEATEISTDVPLMVGGKQLNAGKYSLWARKTGETTWTLAFHPRNGIWGLPEMRDGFIAEAPLTQETAPNSRDILNIALTSSGKNVNIEIHWGTAKLVGTFQTM